MVVHSQQTRLVVQNGQFRQTIRRNFTYENANFTYGAAVFAPEQGLSNKTSLNKIHCLVPELKIIE